MILAYDGLKYATFEEWKALGFYVKRGEKSYMVADAAFVALFSEGQVERGRYSKSLDAAAFTSYASQFDPEVTEASEDLMRHALGLEDTHEWGDQ